MTRQSSTILLTVDWQNVSKQPHCEIHGFKPRRPYLRIIYTNDDNSVHGSFFNGVKVPDSIDRLDGPVHPPAGGGLASGALLQFLHTCLPPLAHKLLFVLLTRRGTFGGVAFPQEFGLLLYRLVGRLEVVEASDTEQRPAEGALPRALKGLRIGDDTLGTRVRVELGRGDGVGGGPGDHVVG